MAEIPIIDIDLRGKACPEPVIETRKALAGLDSEGILTVTLDNPAARSNVTRFAESQGFTVTESETGTKSETKAGDEIFKLTISRGFSCDLPAPETPEAPIPAPAPAADFGDYVVCIDRLTMGDGEERLGGILLKAFLKTLPELEKLPRNIIFLNQGVFLTTADSPEITTLKSLAASGCGILVCGTCLDFYNLKDKLAIGQVSNMFEIANLLTGPDKVVRL